MDDKKDKRALRDTDKAIAGIHPYLTGKGDLTEAEKALIAAVADHAEDRIVTAASRVSYRMLREAANLGKVKWDRLDVLDSLSPKTDNPVRQMIATLRHMHDTYDVLARHKLRSYAPVGSLSADVKNDLYAAHASVAAKYDTPVVHMVQEAKIASLHDRDRAADIFRKAFVQDKAYIKANENERGVTTYYSETEVMSVPDEPQTDMYDKLVAALAMRDESFASPVLNLVWSTDPKFLRYHGAYWMNLAPFFLSQGYGMVFVVVGDEAEAKAAISEARELVQSLLRFRGVTNPEKFSNSISFVYAPVPAHVASVKTFYACARYFFIETVLQATNAPALVVDMDMAANDVIKGFADKCLEHDFGCPVTSGVSSLYPWRRYIANTVFIRNTDITRTMFSEMRRYIRKGLAEEISWTLDQNALTFVIERALVKGLDMIDFSNLARPFLQGPLGPMFERGV